MLCTGDDLILLGAEGFSSTEDVEKLIRIEKQLKRRFPIGSQVSEFTIINDFVKQVSLFVKHGKMYLNF